MDETQYYECQACGEHSQNFWECEHCGHDDLVHAES